jgi:hypothetical protein
MMDGHAKRAINAHILNTGRSHASQNTPYLAFQATQEHCSFLDIELAHHDRIYVQNLASLSVPPHQLNIQMTAVVVPPITIAEANNRNVFLILGTHLQLHYKLSSPTSSELIAKS